MSRHEYVLEYEPWVVDELRSLPRHLQLKVARRMALLGEEPRPKGFEKLESDGYRIRYASCLIYFRVDDANRVVTTTRVALDPDAGEHGDQDY